MPAVIYLLTVFTSLAGRDTSAKAISSDFTKGNRKRSKKDGPMCHQIIWHHALCLHRNPIYDIRISCLEAVRSADTCYRPEIMDFPLTGACYECSVMKPAASRLPKPKSQESQTVSSTGNKPNRTLDEDDSCRLTDSDVQNAVNDLKSFDLITF